MPATPLQHLLLQQQLVHMVSSLYPLLMAGMPQRRHQQQQQPMTWPVLMGACAILCTCLSLSRACSTTWALQTIPATSGCTHDATVPCATMADTCSICHVAQLHMMEVAALASLLQVADRAV